MIKMFRKLTKKRLKRKSYEPNELRYVFGNRFNKWYLVDIDEWQFAEGFTIDEFNELGPEKARQIYQSPSFFGIKRKVKKRINKKLR